MRRGDVLIEWWGPAAIWVAAQLLAVALVFAGISLLGVLAGAAVSGALMAWTTRGKAYR